MITHKIEVVRPHVVQYGSGGYSPPKLHNQADLDKYLLDNKDFQVGKILKYKSCPVVTNPFSIHLLLKIDKDYSNCSNRGTDAGFLKCYNLCNFSWNPHMNGPNWTRWEAGWDMQICSWDEAKEYIDDNLQNNIKQWAGRHGYALPETCFS